MKNSKIYKSGEVFTPLEASLYSQTHQSPHRFLAYRDFPSLIGKFANIHKVLDFGSGTGASTYYLFEKGYDVVGVDKSQAMINNAKLNFPQINFVEIEELPSLPSFDLIFSSFVLFELATKEEIVNYLNFSSSLLRNEGIFFGITGSENLHRMGRNWTCFDVNYPENSHPSSGDTVKLRLKEPNIEFCDYYWNENDYRECFQFSELELMQVHYPLGHEEDPFNWMEELLVSPFAIFLAKKIDKK